MHHLKKRPIALIFTALCGSSALVACSHEQTPAPDASLVTLAMSARVDGRTQQATELFTEIARLCGHKANGETPEECSQDTIINNSTTMPAPQDISAAARQIRDQSQAIPVSSRGLIASQYSALISQGAVNAPADLKLQIASSTNTADINAIKDALSWEYSTIAGLSIASAYTHADVDSILAAHRDVAEYLAHLLQAANIDAPVASAGYTFNGTTPNNEDTANAFVAQAKTQAVNLWLNAAQNAQSSQWYAASLWALGAVSAT
ncbi:MAG: hypothetical protein Q3962_03435 [Corynebacterium sp.]|nr:hypothetical protein [Corynebacterium sp.]